MDLDDMELKATREANGASKKKGIIKIKEELDQLSNLITDLSRTYNLKFELQETEYQNCKDMKPKRIYKILGIIPEERI